MHFSIFPCVLCGLLVLLFPPCLLELASKLRGSGGAEPPQIIGVRIEVSSPYAVCCLLHAVCCMLYAVLYALCCILHEGCVLFRKHSEMPNFFQILLKIYQILVQKSIQNGIPPRIYQKSIKFGVQNHSKMGSRRVREPFPEAILLPDQWILDSTLGAFWGHVGLENL